MDANQAILLILQLKNVFCVKLPTVMFVLNLIHKYALRVYQGLMLIHQLHCVLK